jgi:hypothetical protein
LFAATSRVGPARRRAELLNDPSASRPRRDGCLPQKHRDAPGGSVAPASVRPAQ